MVYALQAARDRYRDLTAVTTGMNWELINKFIKVISLFNTFYSYHAVIYSYDSFQIFWYIIFLTT